MSSAGDTILHHALRYALQTGNISCFSQLLQGGARATVFNTSLVSPLLLLLRQAAVTTAARGALVEAAAAAAGGGDGGEVQHVEVVPAAMEKVLAAWRRQVRR